MLHKINNMIKRAFISRAGDDLQQFPVAQITYMGTVADTEIWWPYGYACNPAEGSYCITLNIQGQEENRISFVYDPDNRPKGLQTGENAFFNPLTGTMIKNSVNGDQESFIKGNKILTIDKDLNITVTGNINITCSGTVNINCPTINLGEGGEFIARVGDAVEVDTNTGIGTITSGSSNNKSN